MPQVRSFYEMDRKYKVKYEPDNVRVKLTAVKDIMVARYEAATSVIYNAVEVARDILSTEGVPTGQWAPYIAFAEILAKLTFSHKGATLNKEVAGLKAAYTTMHGCESNILDQIIQGILGTIPAY